jgi:hypothetical protein
MRPENPAGLMRIKPPPEEKYFVHFVEKMFGFHERRKSDAEGR